MTDKEFFDRAVLGFSNAFGGYSEPNESYSSEGMCTFAISQAKYLLNLRNEALEELRLND